MRQQIQRLSHAGSRLVHGFKQSREEQQTVFAYFLERRVKRHAGYYLDRFLVPSFGTRAQLEEGSRHHVVERPSDELLGRLIDSWQAMKAVPASTPPTYRIGGEWARIVSTTFAPLTRALEARDIPQLTELLSNFFRHVGDCVGEPTQIGLEQVKRARCQGLRAYASRWIDLYGKEALADVAVPTYGNPMAFAIDGRLFTVATFVNNFYARRMADLVSNIPDPVLCEIGGGFGGFACHLLQRKPSRFRYIDYDIPQMCILASYFLISTQPEKRIALYGEIDNVNEPLKNNDAAILPNFALRQLDPAYADIGFNKCSFAEMDKATVEEYMSQFERTCRRYILHVDHSWTPGSRNAFYRPGAGFDHWDLSSVAPSASAFRRLHKIPAPFLSDFYGEFFEWLYTANRE